jgi:very-short-patch-repair endonuclease
VPAPLVNGRRPGYERDFLWPRQRLAVEIDGYAFHGGRDAFERDRRKDGHLLTAGGIVVRRVTWRQLTGDAVATIVGIGQLLAVRGE